MIQMCSYAQNTYVTAFPNTIAQNLRWCIEIYANVRSHQLADGVVVYVVVILHNYT